jgi:glycosyltransferase involved in cell wall biosynthesis
MFFEQEYVMKKKILFIYTNYSTFVKTDYEILASENEVTRYQFVPVKGLVKTAVQFIRQKIYLLINVWKFDAVFIWFADYHSFLPVLFAKITGKKSFVIIGGYDVANMPEIRYGSLSSPLRKKLTLFTFKNATCCLSVVEELGNKIKQVCPKAKTKTLYTGYKFFERNEIAIQENRDKIVLTVSITDNYQRIQVKGLDRFRELAELLPEFQFIIIGANEFSKSFFEPIPQNLILLPPLNQKELTEYYSKSSFFAQLSRSEGLPNALCEAMLYGCIPIGTRVGGIPTGIGSTGLVMNDWDAGIAANYIINNHNIANREACQKRIKEKFDWNLRREKLLNEINQK